MKLDEKQGRLMVVGTVDPVDVIDALRKKKKSARIVSVGPPEAEKESSHIYPYYKWSNTSRPVYPCYNWSDQYRGRCSMPASCMKNNLQDVLFLDLILVYIYIYIYIYDCMKLVYSFCFAGFVLPPINL
jgi:hypothetical protein